MVQADQADVVRRADFTLRVNTALGHDEDGDTLGARRRAFDPREDKVDDVVAQLVVPGGDPHLLALEPVAARLAFDGVGSGLDVGEARTGVRFGQTHGAKELTREHGRQPLVLLLSRRVRLDQVGRADGQEGVARRGDVHGLEERRSRLCDGPGQGKAAVFFIVVCSKETGLFIGLHRVFHFGDQLNHTVHHARLVEVSFTVVRREGFVGDFPRCFEHSLEGLAIMFLIAWQILEVVYANDFKQGKGDFARHEFRYLHNGSSCRHSTPADAALCKARSNLTPRVSLVLGEIVFKSLLGITVAVTETGF